MSLEFIFNIIFFVIIVMMAIVIIQNMKKNKLQPFEYNRDNSKMFLKELKTMIEYETAYIVNIKFGDYYANKKSVDNEISNDTISEAADEIEKRVLNNMSDVMKVYLYTSFGVDWIHDYIVISTLSLTNKLASQIISE